MTFSEMETAVAEAEATLSRADAMANKLARLLLGRLRKVNGYGVLKELKRELRAFDAGRQRWKETK
jgi:hypothetical protein